MASHQVAIAKASLAAALLRPDPTSVSSDDIADFHSLLDKTITQCSPVNIQNCKRWLLRNTVSSSARITALGKYLTALSASFVGSENVTGSDSTRPRPSARRKRLHVLYLINDLIHHAKYHDAPSGSTATITSKLQPLLVELFGAAASFQDCPKHHKKVRKLLDTWDSKGYYHKDYVDKLREAVSNAENIQSLPADAPDQVHQQLDAKAPFEGAATKSAVPFVMPAAHGDIATPYYDLPAGNMMPHIVPNSSTPVNPNLLKPLQFVAGPADESLATIVKDFLKDTEKIFGPSKDDDEEEASEIDELGQRLTRDKATGEFFKSQGYYGWSRAFCEQMKRWRNGRDMSGGNERMRSESRGRNTRPRKRRRYSYSDSSRSRSRGRSPSSTRSRSDSRRRLKGGRHNGGTGLDSRSRSPSHPRSRRKVGRRERSYSSSRSPRPRRRSDSYSPSDRPSLSEQDPPTTSNRLRNPPHFPGIPGPAPAPPLLKGQWPPPPPPPFPPPLSSDVNTNMPGMPGMPYPIYGQPGFSIPPPPPPPPLGGPPEKHHPFPPPEMNRWSDTPQQPSFNDGGHRGGRGRGHSGGRGW